MRSSRTERPGVWPIGHAALVLLLGALTLACASTGPAGKDQASIDAWIDAEVRRVLGEEPDVVVGDLRIETREGIVVLSGVQPSLEAVSKALERASRVRGVLQVVNRIRVVEGLQQLDRLNDQQHRHGGGRP